MTTFTVAPSSGVPYADALLRICVIIDCKLKFQGLQSAKTKFFNWHQFPISRFHSIALQIQNGCMPASFVIRHNDGYRATLVWPHRQI